MKQLRYIATNLQSATVRHEQFEGRDYLVAPVVPIVQGVLNDYFVPAEEISAFVESWNGIPLPVNHPTNARGEYISANSPIVIEQSIGRFFNARMDGNRLVGELWIDVEKCNRLGGDAAECLRRLEAGERLEVSTAFWSEDIQVQGVYNGSRYVGIHTKLRPDHLALLPHTIGACDWHMGCGSPRTHNKTTCNCHPSGNREGAMPYAEDEQGLIARGITAITDLVKLGSNRNGKSLAAHLTHDDIRMALCSELARLEGGNAYDLYSSAFVVDVEDSYVIYRKNERMYRRQYEIGANNEITVTGEPEEVQQDTRYVPVGDAGVTGNNRASQSPAQQGGSTVEKKAHLVQSLITHKRTKWQEKDKDFLAGLSEEQLIAMKAEADLRDEQPAANQEDPKKREEMTAALIAHEQTPWKEEDRDTLATFSIEQLTALKAKADDKQKAAEAAKQPPAQAQQVTMEGIQALISSGFAALEKKVDEKLETFTAQSGERAERQQLVVHLLQHDFTEDDLKPMSLEALRKMAQRVAPASFAGLGLPAFAGNAEDNGPSDDVKWN